MTEHKATPEQWGHVEEYGISLLERVAAAITEACPNYGDASPQEARAAINEVAMWLRERDVEIAGDLQREIKQQPS